MKLLNSLFLILLPIISVGQPWPSAAIAPLETRSFETDENRLSVCIYGSSKEDASWQDRKSSLVATVGLNRGLALQISSGVRDLSGFGAFQRGMEDSRIGMTWTRPVRPVASMFVGGELGLPTGYRQQQQFYNAVSDTSGILPSFSLGQTCGEVFGGIRWKPSPVAMLAAQAGYFSSSDRTEQAFRWVMLAALAPFGAPVQAEFGYAQSLTRVGDLPDTQTLMASAPIRLIRYLTLAPGIWSELGHEPALGTSLSLRFETQLRRTNLKTVPSANLNPEPRRTGRVLVSSPLTDVPLADRDELWNSLRRALESEFVQVTPLSTLDLPGLPYRDTDDESLLATAKAIAVQHPSARWLVVSRVEQETITRAKDIKSPWTLERPAWQAECRLRVRWIDLLSMTIYPEQTIEARATLRPDSPLLMASPTSRDILSLSESRRLTFEAYRAAGQEITRDIPRVER